MSDRDDAARERHKAVPCVVCGKMYYPGLSSDLRRPVAENGKKIRISSADFKGFCTMTCQRIGYDYNGRKPFAEAKYRQRSSE